MSNTVFGFDTNTNFTSDLNMNGNDILDVNTIDAQNIQGTIAPNSDVDLVNAYRVINSLPPVNGNDCTTKSYVDGLTWNINSQITNTQAIDSVGNILQYDNNPSFTLSQQIVDKNYTDTAISAAIGTIDNSKIFTNDTEVATLDDNINVQFDSVNGIDLNLQRSLTPSILINNNKASLPIELGTNNTTAIEIADSLITLKRDML